MVVVLLKMILVEITLRFHDTEHAHCFVFKAAKTRPHDYFIRSNSAVMAVDQPEFCKIWIFRVGGIVPERIRLKDFSCGFAGRSKIHVIVLVEHGRLAQSIGEGRNARQHSDKIMSGPDICWELGRASGSIGCNGCDG